LNADTHITDIINDRFTNFKRNAFATLTDGLAALTLAAAVVSRWALRAPAAPCPTPAAPRAPR